MLSAVDHELSGARAFTLAMVERPFETCPVKNCSGQGSGLAPVAATLIAFCKGGMRRRDADGRRIYAGYRMNLAVIRFLSAKLIADQLRAAMWVRAWAIPAGHRVAKKKNRRP